MRRATGVLVLAAMLTVTGGSLAGGAAAATSAPPARAVAVYEWHRPGTLALTEARRRFAFLRANGFRTVYLELGDWVDAADRPRDDPDRQRQLDVIRYHLRRYVAAASGYGLAVQATGGGPGWTGELGYLAQLLVKLVGDYSATVTAKERLQGVQLDIEPYVEGGWHDDTQTSLSRYLKTVWGVVTTYRRQLARPASRSLQLGFAVPFWFDGEGDAPRGGRLQRRHQAGRPPPGRHAPQPPRGLPGDHELPQLHRRRRRVDRPRPQRALVRPQGQGQVRAARRSAVRPGQPGVHHLQRPPPEHLPAGGGPDHGRLPALPAVPGPDGRRRRLVHGRQAVTTVLKTPIAAADQ